MKEVLKETAVQKEAMAISKDMRELYNAFKDKGVERSEADTAANIAGKNIRALGLVIADKALQRGIVFMEKKTEAIE